MRFKDLTGEKFGKLLVIERLGSKNGRSIYRCMCDCTNEKIADGGNLVSGNIKSCGCLQGSNFKSHGLSSHKLYGVWESMKNRCYREKDKRYEHYGGRGITVYDDWLNFENFYQWSISNGYKEGLTIDRIDVNGNYEPDNCRWVTTVTQNNNRRNTIRVEYKGELKPLSEWSKLLGISYGTLHARLFTYGMSVERAFYK